MKIDMLSLHYFALTITENLLFHNFTNNMPDHYVGFLDSRRAFRWNADALAQILHGAPFFSRQAIHLHVLSQATPMASRMLGEFPLVEIAKKRSRSSPRAQSSLEKTLLKE
jgi:hypothetical protein